MLHVKEVDKIRMDRKVKGFSKAAKAAMSSAVFKWHAEYAKQHFSPIQVVRAKYPEDSALFKPRTKGYSIYKAKRYGHANILEFSGQTRRLVLSSIRIVGSIKRLRGTMVGTRALNFSKDHQLRQELVITNNAEREVLAKIVETELTEFMNKQEK